MKCEVYNNELALYDCFEFKDYLKNAFGARWLGKEKAWLLPLTKEVVEALRARLACEIGDSVYKYFDKRAKLKETLDSIKKNEFIPYIDFNQYSNFKLMNHQDMASSMSMELYNNGFNGSMLSMEMGTGKTLSAIATIGELTKNNGVDKILVVCPVIAMGVWEEEYEKFAKYPYALGVLKGTPAKRIKIMNETISSNVPKIIIINYDYVKAFEEILNKWNPDAIICDESHKIKSPSAQRTKSLLRIAKDVKYKMCLTGTPLTKDITDFFTQYKFLDPSIFGNSYTAFKSRYIVTGMFGEYLSPNKRNFNEFKEKVDSISYRVETDDAIDLPDFKDITINIELSPKARAKYKELEEEYITWLNEQEYVDAQTALVRTLKLRQLTGGFLYDSEKQPVWLDTAKLDYTMEIITTLVESGKKVVVFAEFQAEIEKLSELCSMAGIKNSTYYGVGSQKTKDAGLHSFRKEDAMVFIGQISSASVSINLTVSPYIIYYSTGYKYGDYDQSRRRTRRKGQTEKCFYYHMRCKDTIDQKIANTLEKKDNLARSIYESYLTNKKKTGGNKNE